MITLILETIDKFSQYKSQRQFAHYAGEDAASRWDDIFNYLYHLLGEIYSFSIVCHYIDSASGFASMSPNRAFLYWNNNNKANSICIEYHLLLWLLH